MKQDELKQQIIYDPNTGVFTRKGVTWEGRILGTLTREGCLTIRINKKGYLAHKLANLYMEGDYNVVLAHLNYDRTDNRWCNLGKVTKLPTGILTKDTLQEFFNYNTVTGEFTVKKLHSQHSRVGDTVGSRDIHGYYRVTIYDKMYRIHSLIWVYMTGKYPDMIDHIDRNPSNNKWENLRECTSSQNACNTLGKSSNISGIKGIVKYGKTGGYRATVTKNNIRHSKCFRELDDAIEYIRDIRERVHGKFTNHGEV